MEIRQETIYVTRDYMVFNRLKGNRQITNKRVAIIKASIEMVGYISNPIIVNEHMEIIDGQGRAKALEELDLPIEYKVVKGLGIAECRAMNLKPTSWTIDDFVESYAEYGVEGYVLLKELKYKYGFGYTLLHSLAQRRANGGARPQGELRDGTFKMSKSEQEKLATSLEYLKEFKDIQKKIGGRRDLFYGCIGFISLLPGVDLERLKVSVHQQVSSISPFSQTEPSLKELSDVYNKGYSKKNRRYFDYEWKTGNAE